MTETETTATAAQAHTAARGLLDTHLPVHEVVITGHLVFDVVQNFDLRRADPALVTALMTLRTKPSRLPGRTVDTPATLMLARDRGALPGRTILGEVPGKEVAFGAVGTFWDPDIRWRDVSACEFAAFAVPGWDKIVASAVIDDRLTRSRLHLLIGASALGFSVFYFVSDVWELAGGGFSGPQLVLTFLAEAAIPLFVLGLYSVQRPYIGVVGLWGTVGYASAYIFFTGTVTTALFDRPAACRRANEASMP